ncbi:hypothetical protein JMUB6875_03030 [Nocardia sp. JMUB6875]
MESGSGGDIEDVCGVPSAIDQAEYVDARGLDQIRSAEQSIRLGGNLCGKEHAEQAEPSHYPAQRISAFRLDDDIDGPDRLVLDDQDAGPIGYQCDPSADVDRGDEACGELAEADVEPQQHRDAHTELAVIGFVWVDSREIGSRHDLCGQESARADGDRSDIAVVLQDSGEDGTDSLWARGRSQERIGELDGRDGARFRVFHRDCS